MQFDIPDASWTINSVVRRRTKIDLQPLYQRPSVCNDKQKQELIDSILRGYDLPKFYIRSCQSIFEHEVIDGQQRIRAIWGYIDDEYRLSDESKDIPYFGDLSGKKYTDLNGDQQEHIGRFPLSVVIIEKASDLEIRQLFLRLQEGVSLNPAEKRNAMTGKMRDFIAYLGENSKVFSNHCFSYPETRFQWHDLAAIVTCIEIARRPIDVKHLV